MTFCDWLKDKDQYRSIGLVALVLSLMYMSVQKLSETKSGDGFEPDVNLMV